MDAGFIGDEVNALDAISERNIRFGITPEVNQINNSTNNGSIVIQSDTSTADPLSGGSAFAMIGPR